MKRGYWPTQPYYGGLVRQNVVGAISPADRQPVSLIVPHNDTEVVQVFLNNMAREVPAGKGKRVVFVRDNE